MKGWREHTADIFAKHGEIAAKNEARPEVCPHGFLVLLLLSIGRLFLGTPFTHGHPVLALEQVLEVVWILESARC